MNGRQRSPSYPSTPLAEAIDITRRLHLVERTNPVDRDVAAKALGYTGISGRSATVLSNLIQYGLLEKTGKNEVRVTRRAVDILYPDNPESRLDALHDAANEPDLFSAISAKFPDGRPSEAAIEAYLVRQGYTHTAVRPATRAYQETFLFLENETGSESLLPASPNAAEPHSNQHVDYTSSRPSPVHPSAPVSNPVRYAGGQDGFDVRIFQKRLWLAGTVSDRAEADELIETIKSLRDRLPEPPQTRTSSQDVDLPS